MQGVAISAFCKADIPQMAKVWNAIVQEGVAFPQLEYLDESSAASFFEGQTHCGVAKANGSVVGLYTLHPNNVGRCGHICNAAYAILPEYRGRGIGKLLVEDCLERSRENGFKILQFNAVVASNTRARKLYESLGFVQLGVIPGGFRMDGGRFENICPYYKML